MGCILWGSALGLTSLHFASLHLVQPNEQQHFIKRKITPEKRVSSRKRNYNSDKDNVTKCCTSLICPNPGPPLACFN